MSYEPRVWKKFLKCWTYSNWVCFWETRNCISILTMFDFWNKWLEEKSSNFYVGFEVRVWKKVVKCGIKSNWVALCEIGNIIRVFTS
jgi:hypothetical protein